MLKVAIIGVMAVLLAIPLKNHKPEFAMLITLSSCLIILTLALGRLGEIIDVINTLNEYLGDNAVYVGILMKMIGITYVAEFGSNLCKDAGYGAVGNQIEFYGKLMILAVSMPILLTLIDTIGKI